MSKVDTYIYNSFTKSTFTPCSHCFHNPHPDSFASWSQNLSVMNSRNQCEQHALLKCVCIISHTICARRSVTDTDPVCMSSVLELHQWVNGNTRSRAPKPNPLIVQFISFGVSFFSEGGKMALLHAADGNRFLRAPAPASPETHWARDAQKIGTVGWADFRFLFFDPHGDLHAVHGGRFLKGSPPRHSEDNWTKRSICIGSGGWDQFRFLFFHPNGELYAAGNNGQFHKGPPPEFASDNWLARAKVVGTAAWNDFRFLFFGPDGMLYGMFHDKLYKAPPPQYPSDDWLARATCIGSGGWNDFRHLFFDPSGSLYGVRNNGKLLVGAPPCCSNLSYVDHSDVIGSNGWDTFKFLFAEVTF